MSVHLVCILLCVHCGNLNYACVCLCKGTGFPATYLHRSTNTTSTTATTALHHYHHAPPPPPPPHSTTSTTTLHHHTTLHPTTAPLSSTAAATTTIDHHHSLYYLYTTTTTMLLHHQTPSHSTTSTNATTLPVLCRHNYVACNCPITFACLVYSPLQTCVVGLVSCFPRPPLSPATNAFLPALSSQRAVACL